LLEAELSAVEVDCRVDVVDDIATLAVLICLLPRGRSFVVSGARLEQLDGVPDGSASRAVSTATPAAIPDGR